MALSQARENDVYNGMRNSRKLGKHSALVSSFPTFQRPPKKIAPKFYLEAISKNQCTVKQPTVCLLLKSGTSQLKL
jgi:hypothetical protein